VLTHGEIQGFMPAMTMGFRVASPKIQEAVSVGDAVRFTLRGVPPNVAVTTIEKLK
jgi:Cu/Ag efflux protein CusF